MKKKLSIVLTLCLLGGVGSYKLLNVGATDYEAEAGFVSEDINEEDFTAETEEQNTEEPDVFEAENLAETEIEEEVSEQLEEASEQLQETAIQEGTCGKDNENLIWRLEGDGTLRITGNGAMADWEDENSVPWCEVKDKILKIVIENSVTTIGSFAFYNCTQATDVQMPENLEYVGSFSFFNCTGVEAVTIG